MDMPADKHGVSLWVRGESLEPSYVTRSLDLQPTASVRKGEFLPNRLNKIAPVGSWHFNERPDDDWDSLETALLSVCRLLLPRKAELGSLALQHEVFLSCAIYISKVALLSHLSFFGSWPVLGCRCICPATCQRRIQNESEFAAGSAEVGFDRCLAGKSLQDVRTLWPPTRHSPSELDFSLAGKCNSSIKEQNGWEFH